MIVNAYEIFEQFESADTIERKKEVLIKNGSPWFKYILKCAFDPSIEFYVKEFPSNYIVPDTVPGIRDGGLESEWRRLYLFMKGNETADALTEQKRNILLLQFLEGMEPKDAVITINMMKKDFGIKGLTKELVLEVFPGLF